jgi:hypothetical protein
VTTVDHEFLRAKACCASIFVDDLGLCHEFAPVGRRMDVDLDNTGVGRDAEIQQPRIAAGRRIALDEDRLAEHLGRILDCGDEIEIILGALDRRHEDM